MSNELRNMSIDRKGRPKHIAIIMDGNRRWAMKHKKFIISGHRRVVFETLEPLVRKAASLGIRYLTFWAWSTENWKRSPLEVRAIMGLFREGLKHNDEIVWELDLRLNFIGDMSRFPKDIKEQVEGWVKKTEKNKGMTVTFGLNYGGRDEIVRAIKKIIDSVLRQSGIRQNARFAQAFGSEVFDGEAQVRRDDKDALDGLVSLSNKLDEQLFDRFLDTDNMPEPDLIIRTGGEKRLSGFMSWQSAYSELYFTEVLMPDFTPEELDKAIVDYQGRKRRFGK